MQEKENTPLYALLVKWLAVVGSGVFVGMLVATTANAFTNEHSANRHATHTISFINTFEELTLDQAILSYEVSLRILNQYRDETEIDEAGQLVIETEWENVTEEHKSIVSKRNFLDSQETEHDDGTTVRIQTHNELHPYRCSHVHTCPDRFAKRKQYVYSRFDLLDSLHDKIDDLRDDLVANYATEEEAPSETPAQNLPTVPTFDPSQCPFGVDPDDLTECADEPAQ